MHGLSCTRSCRVLKERAPALVLTARYSSARALSHSRLLYEYVLWAGLTDSNVDRVHEQADRTCERRRTKSDGVNEFGDSSASDLNAKQKLSCQKNLQASVRKRSDSIEGVYIRVVHKIRFNKQDPRYEKSA